MINHQQIGFYLKICHLGNTLVKSTYRTVSALKCILSPFFSFNLVNDLILHAAIKILFNLQLICIKHNFSCKKCILCRYHSRVLWACVRPRYNAHTNWADLTRGRPGIHLSDPACCLSWQL